MNKRFGSFSSSANPEVLGRKWQGIFVAISTGCGAVATFIGMPIVGYILNKLGLGSNVTELASNITQIGTAIGLLGGSTLAVYGTVYNLFVIVWDKWLSRVSFLK